MSGSFAPHLPPAYVPALDAGGIARDRGEGLIVKRWAATVLDTFACGGLFVVVGLLSQGRGSWPFPVWCAAVVAYYVVLEGRFGATVGRLVTKTRVVDHAGRPPGFAKAAIRTAFRLIEVNPVLMGGIPAAVVVGLSKTRQRLGDLAAGTYVLTTDEVRRLQQVVDVTVF